MNSEVEMQIDIVAVVIDQKEVLRNLLEKYDYEFSQYDGRDVDSLGLYGYEWLDNYWQAENQHAFFIKADGRLAGFIMINDYCPGHPEVKYYMSEFCILYKYRRQGVGRFAVEWVLNKFRGGWGLAYHPKNMAAKHFWHTVIGDYIGGPFEFAMDAKIDYPDGARYQCMYFNTAEQL